MKLCKYLFCVVIFIIIGSNTAIAGDHSSKMDLNESAILQKKEIATFESHDKWKATLYSSLWNVKGPVVGGKETMLKNIIYYIEILPKDSNEVQRIWQCQYPFMERNPSFTPYDFSFGPMTNDKFCIAFLEGSKLNYFILDPNSRVIPYNESSKPALEKNSPTASILNRDPNNVISLSHLFSKKIFPSYSPNNMFLNSVFGYENYSVFDLTIKKQKFILRYSIVDGEPVYSVYKVTDLEKQESIQENIKSEVK